MLESFDLTDPQKIIPALVLITPGAVIMYIRSFFLTGRRKSHTDEALIYVFLSCLYFVLTWHGYIWLLNYFQSPFIQTITWVLYLIALPAIFGVLFGLNIRKGWIRSLLSKLNLYTVHSMPTAWDWRFSDQTACFVIIKTKQGKYFRGYFGQKSFASSDGERDIFLEKIYTEDPKGGPWLPLEQSLWISANEIETIEFINQTGS